MNRKVFHLATTHFSKTIFISPPLEKPLLDGRGIVVAIEKIPAETIDFIGQNFQTDDPKILKQLLELNQYDQSFQFVEPKSEVEDYIAGFSSEPRFAEVTTETPVEEVLEKPRRGRPPR